MVDYAVMGQRLRRRRSQAGFTQEQVARKLHVTPTYISRIERGTTRLSLKMLDRICDVIGADPGCVISGSIPREPKYLKEEWMTLMESMSPHKRSLAIDILRLIHQFEDNQSM